MSFRSLCLVAFTVMLGSAAGACSAPLARPAVASVEAGPCGGATLKSDAEVAAFAHCSEVQGDLRIEGGVTDLDSLGSLRRVAGTLSISNTNGLEDLRGLERLTSVGALEIAGNERLERTLGLGNLQRVGKLVVKHNSQLVSLGGLKSLQRAESVEISNNRVLAGYFGLLPRLARVEEQLVLRQNLGLSKREVAAVIDRIPQGKGAQSASNAVASVQ
jgi:hypothetical protein